MSGSAIRTLVLSVAYPSRASYYDDWREAFEAAPAFAVDCANVFHGGARRRVARRLGDYELIVLLHSCTADSLYYITPLAGALQARRGRLLAFIGNEVNLPSAPIAPKRAFLKSIAPDFVATQLPLEAGDYLWGDCGGRVIAVPHALNPDAFRPERPCAERPVDLGTRSYRYLAYLGDDDRNRIYDFFREHRFASPPTLDFATDDRFERAGWAAFLNRCKGTVSTEAGSWYIERDDATVTAIRAYFAGQRKGLVVAGDSPLRRLAHRLPYGFKAWLKRLMRAGPLRYEAAADEAMDWAEIEARFFADRPRCPAYGKCISSRHFDAIGTKTLQIMFPGRFNDILVADRHYLALAPDFSNIDDVMYRFRDPDHHCRLVDEAHDFVRAGHTYADRLAALARTLGEGGD